MKTFSKDFKRTKRGISTYKNEKNNQHITPVQSFQHLYNKTHKTQINNQIKKQ